MDRDYDGRLSFGEFMGEETPLEKVVMAVLLIKLMVVIIMTMMVDMRLSVTMLQVFKNMDKDGSGTVSKDEFLKICKNLSKEQVSTSQRWSFKKSE